MNLNKRLDGKTGLGSSAALTSSLVAALFGYFGLLPADSGAASAVHAASAGHKRNLLFAHNLAQFCHCAAQGLCLFWALSRLLLCLVAHLPHNSFTAFCVCGVVCAGKVGSGFDVSAAFFGSQKYRRFSPAVIDPLLKVTRIIPVVSLF